MISSKTRSRFNQEKEEEEKEEEGYIKFTKTIQSFQLTLRALFLEKKRGKAKKEREYICPAAIPVTDIRFILEQWRFRFGFSFARKK